MEFITIVAVANGIQYLYKFVKVAEVYYNTTEIFNKITAKTIYKHADNINNLYEISTYLLASKQPGNLDKRLCDRQKLQSDKKKNPYFLRDVADECSNLNNKNKKKSKLIHSKMKMFKMLNIFSDVGHYYYIKRLERDERRALSNKAILYEEKIKRENYQDEINEKRLFKLGYLRDSTSRYYINPLLLL